MVKTKFSTIIQLLFLSFLLVGCGSTSSADSEEKNTESFTEEGNNEETSKKASEGQSETDSDSSVADISEFKQSPYLEDMELPAVEERLPEIPKITNEMDEAQLNYENGQYGGVLSVISGNPETSDNFFVMVNEPLINTPGLLGEAFTPNVVENFEVNEDDTVFTFHMRKGLKWSDGEEVTTEDVLFTYENVYQNEELTPNFPAKYRTAGSPDGEPMNLEVVDDYTFVISFDGSYGGFLNRIAIQGWESYSSLIKPKHYLQDYHTDHVALDSLQEEITDAGYAEDEWFNLFHDKDINGMEFTSEAAADFPTLNPWIFIESGDGLQKYQRNPYYFKVDSEGNQLPYIDEAESVYVQDKEMENLEIISGNIDYVRSDLSNVALYRENEERGNYEVVMREQHSKPGNVFFNHNFEDEAWQSAVEDVRFRQALNLAIDNEEVINNIYLTFADVPTDYNEGTHDIEQANLLLDEMGMDERDEDGYRLAPNGEELQINIEVYEAAEYVPMAELLVEYWSDLDLNTSMRSIDQTLYSTRTENNEIQATVHRFENYWWQGNNRPDIWAPEWNLYYETNGQDGEEPPEEVYTFLDLANQVRSESVEEGMQAYEEILEMNKENLYFITITMNAQQPQIVNQNLRNIPDSGSGIAMNFSAEQFFFEE